jgi:hypothetical protein
MKKVLLFALAAGMLASCSNDDENTISGGNNSGNLAGTWKMTGFTVSTPVDLNGDGTAGNDVIAETGCYDNSVMIFSSNGSVSVKSQESGYNVETGEMTCDRLPTQNGNYTVQADVINITVAGETFAFTRTGNTLTGTDDSAFGQATMVFTKQ